MQNAIILTANNSDIGAKAQYKEMYKINNELAWKLQ